MELDFTDKFNFVLRKVFVPVILEAESGEILSVCMRDDAFEITLRKKNVKGDKWYTASSKGVELLLDSAEKGVI